MIVCLRSAIKKLEKIDANKLKDLESVQQAHPLSMREKYRIQAEHLKNTLFDNEVLLAVNVYIHIEDYTSNSH